VEQLGSGQTGSSLTLLVRDFFCVGGAIRQRSSWLLSELLFIVSSETSFCGGANKAVFNWLPSEQVEICVILFIVAQRLLFVAGARLSPSISSRIVLNYIFL